MVLRPLRVFPLKRTIVFLMMLSALQNVNSKPQQSSVFENVASQSLAIAGNMAEVVGNAGMISKNTDFEVPFAKVKSESKAGTGAALRNDDDDSDSEDEDEDRRKRSTDILIGEEFLLPLSHNHQPHFHRDKRTPCHTYGGGTGGGGGMPADDDDLDTVRWLRAYARKRKAAAKKAKRKTTSTGNRKRKFINNEDDADGEHNQALERRKRQSEVDDLNQNMQNVSDSLAQHAQQIAEKIRQTFKSFATAMNDMAQQLKQHFSGQNTTNAMEI